MKTYTVPPGTQVIVLSDTAAWRGLNFRLIQTQKTNHFSEDEVILDPVTCICKHFADNAQVFGPAYGRNGYYGFRQNGYIMLALQENVMIATIKVA